jgi:hypothetical protein
MKATKLAIRSILNCLYITSKIEAMMQITRPTACEAVMSA